MTAHPGHHADLPAAALLTLLDGTADIVLVKGLDGRLIYCNEAMAQFVGRPVTDLVGAAIATLAGPEVGACLFDGDPRALADGKSRSTECALVGCDGARTFLSSSTAYLSPDGEVLGELIIARDISERKATEEFTRQLAEQLEMAQAVANIGSWTSDLAASKITWSTQTHRILETDPARHVPSGSNFQERVHPDDRDAFEAAFRQSLRTGAAQILEQRLQLPSGASKVVELRWQVFGDVDGKPARVLGTCQDITERRQAELKLRESEMLISMSSQMARVGGWSVDLASMQMSWTPMLAQIHEVTDQVQATVVQALAYYAPEHRAAMQATFEACMVAGTTFDVEHEIISPRGRRVWVRVIGEAVRDDSGRIIRVQGALQDVSALKRAELALRDLNAELESRVLARTAELTAARDAAQQASRAKSAFLATMSHEIRTPMNGVIGMIEVLQQSGLPAAQMEMVGLIRDSALSLLDIVEDVLDFSKIEAGKLTLESAPVHLEALIERVCGMLDPMAVKQGVRLSMFVDPSIPTLVETDAGRLRQVLVNLVGNAIKFTGGRGPTGRVSVRVVVAARTEQGIDVDMIVSDNGIGMDAATIGRLFTPFTQGDVSTTRRFGGSGLGLAISATLVNLMGGSMRADSQPGEGATFTVRLPLTTVPESADQLPGEAPPLAADHDQASGLHCRIVGDEQPLADDLGVYLRAAGVLVEHASSLTAAARMPPPRPLCLWLILPQTSEPDVQQLRALAPRVEGVDTRFVVLGSGRRRLARLHAPGVVTIDANVLCRRSLISVLALAAGRRDLTADERAPPAWSAANTPGVAMPPAAIQPGRLILVAEDNATNRRVIMLQLQLIGFAADIVDNGKQALERWRSGNYALLLTDLHMPEMDGYALAQAIRADESNRAQDGSGAGHTPIIALTANALPDEERYCLRLGMDAYLSKPVRIARLREVLEAWLGPAQSPAGAPADDAEPVFPGPIETVDLRVLMSLIGPEPAGMAEVLQAFRHTLARCGRELAACVERSDVKAAANAAHTLKSAAWSIGAKQLGDVCAQLEHSAIAASSTPDEDVRTHPLHDLLATFQRERAAVIAYLDARDASQ